MFVPHTIDDPSRLPDDLRDRLVPAAAAIPEAVDRRVAAIIARVRESGDAALTELTRELDGVELTPSDFHVGRPRLEELARGVSGELRRAVDGMIANVRRFHEPQRRAGYSLDGPAGSRLSWRLRPVGSAAVYVPGGQAVYPSTVVMNVVPAHIAGVPRIVALTPPAAIEAHPVLAYAFVALDVHEVIGLGGAQAIAAAAWGTESIRPVDLIVGPGNAYVAAAKRAAFGQVGIDSIAGPSEVVILADETAPVDWVVGDLLAQAEHDELARSILITPSPELAAAVAQGVVEAVAAAPRAEIIRAALRARGANCVVRDLASGVAVVNAIAPEHLQVMVAATGDVGPDDFVAGAIFWGPHTPTAIGDYWAGPNHVLPTGGTARFRGPLGVDDFLVPTSVVHYSERAARTGLADAQRLAEAEGLWAHARSLNRRRG